MCEKAERIESERFYISANTPYAVRMLEIMFEPQYVELISEEDMDKLKRLTRKYNLDVYSVELILRRLLERCNPNAPKFGYNDTDSVIQTQN